MSEQPLKRNNYFHGKLLGADDFKLEQDYFLGKQRRHNRLLLGSGIVTGLDLSVTDDSVAVTPGVAIDPSGREIVVPDCQWITIADGNYSRWYVVLQYAEKEVDPVPAMASESVAFAHIEESFQLHLTPADLPAEDKTAATVTLGEIVRAQSAWMVNARFRRPLVRRVRPDDAPVALAAGLVLGLVCSALLFGKQRK